MTAFLLLFIKNLVLGKWRTELTQHNPSCLLVVKWEHFYQACISKYYNNYIQKWIMCHHFWKSGNLVWNLPANLQWWWERFCLAQGRKAPQVSFCWHGLFEARFYGWPDEASASHWRHRNNRRNLTQRNVKEVDPHVLPKPRRWHDTKQEGSGIRVRETSSEHLLWLNRPSVLF